MVNERVSIINRIIGIIGEKNIEGNIWINIKINVLELKNGIF